jgi:hypothetical protein
MFDERMINILESMKIPNTYWRERSYEYKYWFRSLLQKIDSCLIFKNLPKTWSQDFFLGCLWWLGFVGVFKSERFGDPESGLTFQPGVPAGFDFYYQPERFIVSNPKLTKEFTVHKDIEILKLTPDFCGVVDIVDYYASKLAELSKGIDMGLINAKMPIILTANSQAQSSSLKAVYDKVQAGESLVIWKDQTDHFDEVIPRKDPFETWTNDYKSTYIVSELLENMKTILDSFYTEIGLPVAIEKSAHALDQEADFMAAQSQARIACWVQTLNESFDYIEDTFGLRLEVEYARDESMQDEPIGSRDVSEQDRRY